MAFYRYTINKTVFYSVLLLPVFYILSYSLISAYTGGDQEHYRRFYSALSQADIHQVMFLARYHVASAEPISAYLLWTGSALGIDKDIFISLLNLVLLLGLFLLGKKYKVGSVPLFLLMTNFYLVVLLTGAERLKIAYIMIIWAELLSGNKGRVMAGLSPLAHLQNFIMMPSLLLASFSDSIRQLLIYGKFKLHFVSSVIILTLFSAFLFAVLYEGVINKAMHYISRNASWYEMWKLALLAMLAILVTRNRWRMCLVLIPLFPAVYLLGGIRVNMIAITLVIYFLMQERVLNHPLVLLLLTYFSIKSVSFIRNIYLYGNGFV